MNVLRNIRHIGGILTENDRHETNTLDGDELAIKEIRANSFDTELHSYANRGSWDIFSNYSLALTEYVMHTPCNCVQIDSTNDGTIYRDYCVEVYSDWTSWYCPMRLIPKCANESDTFYYDRIISILPKGTDVSQGYSPVYPYLFVYSAEGNMYYVRSEATPDMMYGYPDGEYIWVVRRYFNKNIPIGNISGVRPKEGGKPIELVRDWLFSCIPITKLKSELGFYCNVPMDAIAFTTFSDMRKFKIDTNDMFRIQTSTSQVSVNGFDVTSLSMRYSSADMITVKNIGGSITSGVMLIITENCGIFSIPYSFTTTNVSIKFGNMTFDGNNHTTILKVGQSVVLTMTHVEDVWEIVADPEISCSQKIGTPTATQTTFNTTVIFQPNNSEYDRTLEITLLIGNTTYTYYFDQPHE